MDQENNTQVTPENNIQPEEKQGKGKIGIIIAILVVVCALGIGGFFILNKKDDKKEPAKTEEKEKKEETPKKEENKKEEEDFSTYNGLYSNGSKQLSVYCKNKRTCYVDFYEDEYTLYFTQTSIKENEIKEDSFTLKFENGTAIVEEIVKEDYYENGISGTYKKEKEYTEEDLYKNKYGDIELLKTKYNGYYTLNKNKMYIYQKDKDKVRVYIIGSFGSFDVEFAIQKDGTLTTDFFDDEYKITITDDSATFETTKTDKEEKDKDGTYKKEKTLDYKDIIENIEP
ncbi:MAG: hypothetical protein IKQ29_01710 [Bacilli bacterium]|nr:hypothetical protein [Bacilli bacterium]